MCGDTYIIDKTQCQNEFLPLDSLFDDILHDFEAISHLLPLRPTRSAWFGGIGSIMKHVFGTMDEDDSINLENSIQSLYSNNQKLISLTKQNILISKSTITNLNKTLSTISENEGRLNNVTTELIMTLKSVSATTDELLAWNKINNVLNVLQSSLLTISYKIEDVVNSVLFSNSNTLHPSVITPRELYEDLYNNIKYIPSYKQYPVSVEINNINSLLQISEVSTYFSRNKIIYFVISIPLVYYMDYELYQALPIPVSHNASSPNSFTMIIPTKPFVALSKDRTTYCTLENLNHCKTLKSGILVCEISDILSVTTNPICEIELMTKVVTNLPNSCTTNFIFGKINIWQNIGNNKWIFVQSQPSRLTIQCEANVKEVIINGTGILSMKPRCVALNKNVRLLARQNTKHNLTHIHSDFVLINNSCCNKDKFDKFKFNTSDSIISNINLEDLKNLKVLINEENKSIDELNNNSNNISHHVSFPILTIILVITFTIFLIYYFYKTKSQNTLPKEPTDSEDPVPSPRLRIE